MWSNVCLGVRVCVCGVCAYQHTHKSRNGRTLAHAHKHTYMHAHTDAHTHAPTHTTYTCTHTSLPHFLSRLRVSIPRLIRPLCGLHVGWRGLSTHLRKLLRLCGSNEGNTSHTVLITSVNADDWRAVHCQLISIPSIHLPHWKCLITTTTSYSARDS